MTTKLTYFARMANAATFADQASTEVRRRVLHRLKHEGPARVLRHVTWLARRYPQIQEHVTYLQKRRQFMDYPTRPTAGLADWVGEC